MSETAAVEELSATGGTDPAGSAADEPSLDPALLAQVAAFRTRLQASIGEVVLSMLNLPRYRHQLVGDLMPLVVEPMLRDRIAIAKAGGEGRMEETAGIAIWASVSEEVDSRIREQVRARVFPVRLKAEDWTSGDIPWLLDVIAPSPKVATAVLVNFRQIVKDKPVRIHPIVGTLIEPGMLEKMKILAGGDDV